MYSDTRLIYVDNQGHWLGLLHLHEDGCDGTDGITTTPQYASGSDYSKTCLGEDKGPDGIYEHNMMSVSININTYTRLNMQADTFSLPPVEQSSLPFSTKNSWSEPRSATFSVEMVYRRLRSSRNGSSSVQNKQEMSLAGLYLSTTHHPTPLSAVDKCRMNSLDIANSRI